jgi:hypothetical protein
VPPPKLLTFSCSCERGSSEHPLGRSHPQALAPLARK